MPLTPWFEAKLLNKGLANIDFVIPRPYGSLHPVEDWATCVEAFFFMPQTMLADTPGKYAVVANFLRNYRA